MKVVGHSSRVSVREKNAGAVDADMTDSRDFVLISGFPDVLDHCCFQQEIPFPSWQYNSWLLPHGLHSDLKDVSPVSNMTIMECLEYMEFELCLS